ncbi:hypothetical protein HUJ05_010419 [Dendroctonus ponderosae]|nr:hypothetical protein HUJ05_010419 [Dendroctonus ponderosae]
METRRLQTDLARSNKRFLRELQDVEVSRRSRLFSENSKLFLKNNDEIAAWKRVVGNRSTGFSCYMKNARYFERISVRKRRTNYGLMMAIIRNFKGVNNRLGFKMQQKADYMFVDSITTKRKTSLGANVTRAFSLIVKINSVERSLEVHSSCSYFHTKQVFFVAN